MNAQVQNIVHSHNTLWVCCLARESANRPTHSQGFFQLIREMGSVTPNSEKWVTLGLPLMPTKKIGSLQRQQKFLIITKHTLHVCNNEQMWSLIHKHTVQ